MRRYPPPPGARNAPRIQQCQHLLDGVRCANAPAGGQHGGGNLGMMVKTQNCPPPCNIASATT
jgi:hypothetical protein